jgi:hypothetical protein
MKQLQMAVGTLALLLGIMVPVSAQTCTPLAVVKGEGTSVTKRVSPPNAQTIPKLPVGYRGNWDTDFVVPFNTNFKEYIAIIRSESTEAAQYRIKMYLKYSDDTADETFNEAVQLQPGQSTEVISRPRSGNQPYQINVNVGGYESIGYSYTLSVEGCL